MRSAWNLLPIPLVYIPYTHSDNKTLKRPNEPDIVSQQILDATKSDRDGGEQPISVLARSVGSYTYPTDLWYDRSAESAVTQLFKTFPYAISIHRMSVD